MAQVKRRKKSPKKQQHTAIADLVQRVHPSLRAKFIPLPKPDDVLTDEQLAEIFGGDLKALRDVIKLAKYVVQDNTEL